MLKIFDFSYVIFSPMQPLNYEESSNLSLTVTVENEEPFFYCRITGRPTHGLWDVLHSRGRSSSTSASFLITSPDTRVIVKHVKSGPMLWAKKLGMCLSEKNTEITVVDPDSPLVHFELMGDVEGEWRLHSNYGIRKILILFKIVIKHNSRVLEVKTAFIFSIGNL